LFLLSLNSCGTKNLEVTINDDFYKIINHEVNYLMANALPWSYKEFLLEKQLNNSAIEISSNRLKINGFNQEEILFLKNQLYENNIIQNKKLDIINETHLKVIDLKNEIQDPVLNSTKGLIILSNPIFTENGEYAIIRHYFGDYLRDDGNDIVTIYKKENNQWIVYKRILLGIG